MNFANPDMVGHTGVISAAVKACQVVDICVGKIAQEAEGNGRGNAVDGRPRKRRNYD